MNDRIKNAGIVLTTGVLLGWLPPPRYNKHRFHGWTECSRPQWRQTVTVLTGATPPDVRPTEGTVARIDVTDGGAGYAAGGVLTVEDLVATGQALTNAEGTFAFEGVVGSLGANAVTLLTGGTGYDPGTDASGNDIVGNLLDADGLAIACHTDWAAGNAGVLTGVTINANTRLLDAGDVGNITIEGGLGYGDVTRGSMVVTVDGVLIEDGSGTCSTTRTATA